MSRVSIRSYDDCDFEEICSWWISHGETPPQKGMMVHDGTFVLELDGNAVMTLTAFMTQSMEVSYFEGFCAKDGLPKDIRNDLSMVLWDHCTAYLKNNGRNRVIIFTDKPRLAIRYETLGMNIGISGLYSLGKEF